MRALLIHAKKFSYVPVQKEIEEAELAAKGERIAYGRCLVFFVSFEKGDDEGKLPSLVEHLVRDAAQVKENEIVVYPFVHLTEVPLEAEQAIKLLSATVKALIDKGFKAHKAPFGWTKSFSLETMPHALAERGIRLRAVLYHATITCPSDRTEIAVRRSSAYFSRGALRKLPSSSSS